MLTGRISLYTRIATARRDWIRAGSLCRDLHVPVVPIRVKFWRHGSLVVAHAWTGEILELQGSSAISLEGDIGAKLRDQVARLVRSRPQSW